MYKLLVTDPKFVFINKGLLQANGNNKVVQCLPPFRPAVETALGQRVTSSMCGVFGRAQ